MARYKMDRLFNKNFSNLGNWISESSDLFDSGLVSYNEYLGAVAAFYYTYGYNDLGDDYIIVNIPDYKLFLKIQYLLLEYNFYF